MSCIYITGCDAAYFDLAKESISSIIRFDSLPIDTLGFLDFGLTETQVRWLEERRFVVRKCGWDFDFPAQSTCEERMPWFKVYLCRPFLRSHFPNHDLYLWLDADTWLQRPEAIANLVDATTPGTLAAVPEVDRSYLKFTRHPGLWMQERTNAINSLGPEIGNKLAFLPVFNAGVFCMHKDAPHWEQWKSYMQQGLNRFPPDGEVDRMVEQVAFNATISLHNFPTHRLPSNYNWLACFAVPSWAIEREEFTEPNPPFRSIGLIHLTTYQLRESARIDALFKGRRIANLQTPITYGGWKALRASREKLEALADSPAKLQIEPHRSETSDEWDYVSPGLERVDCSHYFPYRVIGKKDKCSWPYLRREIPHRWYVDRRYPDVGFLNLDETHILYNIALQFSGKRALEVGCWMGWSACHLAMAGMVVDVIDPLLAKETIYESVTSSLTAAGVRDRVNLVPGMSPQAVSELASREQRKWSLLFIDGDHYGEAPLKDTIEAVKHAEDDAVCVFHDVASPDVAAGLEYLKAQGWETEIYQTMQVMALAKRGDWKSINHMADPRVAWPV
jgi:predicted O-methyltransferase YrrM